MKLKKTILIPTISALIICLAISCKSSEPDTSTSKTYKISDFSSLDVELIGEVFYEQSDSAYLNASGSSALIDDLEISENNGKLSVELENMRKFSQPKTKLMIHVGSPNLETISFKSVGALHIKNTFKGNQLSITNKGVGEIIVDDCQVSSFNLFSESVGLIVIKGTSNETSINSKGVGKIDCSELKSKNVKVVSMGVGELSIYAQDSIDISTTGIGNVNYYGNPASVKTDASGIGKVTRVDR